MTRGWQKYPTISWDDERSESRMMSRVFWISHKSLVQRIPASSGNATSAWIFCTSDECEICARHKSWVEYFRSLRRKVSASTFLIVPSMRKSEFTDFYTKDFKLKPEKGSNSCLEKSYSYIRKVYKLQSHQFWQQSEVEWLFKITKKGLVII